MVVNYEDGILSSIAALRAYYGLSSSFEPDERLAKVLAEKKPEKIFLMLVDAMGANLIKKKLPADAFVNRNMLYKTETVFPPTTTAATTAILNGKAPNENAWLGWAMYFKEIDDTVIPFWNEGKYSGKQYPGFVEKAIPVTRMEKELNESGRCAKTLNPGFTEKDPHSLEEMIDRMIAISKDQETDFVYAYWDKYDSQMHKTGPDSEEADQMLQYINGELERLAEGIAEKTMLIIVADHGQVQIHREVNIRKTPLNRYLLHEPSVEPRAMAFHVREEDREAFAKEFKEMFEKDYVLLDHKQILETKLFGTKENHPRFEEFIGDFLAIAKSDLCLDYDYEDHEGLRFHGQHAGMCADEVYIPVIVYQK